jgi:hypothetical protein
MQASCSRRQRDAIIAGPSFCPYLFVVADAGAQIDRVLHRWCSRSARIRSADAAMRRRVF